MADSTTTQFDVRKFVNDELGYKLLDVGSEPGKVIVEVPSEELMAQAQETGGLTGFLQHEKARTGPQKQELDLNAYLKDAGVDPSTVSYQVSSPQSPLPQSNLSFIDRMKLSLADTVRDKKAVLDEAVGSENVQFSPDAGGFVVKDSESGQWKVAQDESTQNFLAELAGRESGSIAGSIAGAAAGTAIAPGIGTIAGAGIGAVMGKIGTLGTANAMGIRTEEDAAAIGQELGKDLIFSMAGEAALPAIKLVGRGAINALKKSMGVIGEKAANPGARLAIAESLEKATGVPLVDNLTYLENPAATAEQQRRVVDWMESGLKNGTANPVQVEMAEQVQGALGRAKEMMTRDFGAVESKLAPITDKVQVPIADIAAGVRSEFQNLGLIDDSGKWLKVEEQRLAQVINPSSVRQLKQSYDILHKAVTPNAESGTIQNMVSFKEAQILKRNMDEILEAAGHYNASDYALTSPAKRQIINLRTNLNNASIKALENVNSDAAKLYSDMNAKYSQRAGWLDELAGRADDFKIDATIKNMLGDNGQPTREIMRNILSNTGVNADVFMNNLLVRKAAISTAPMYKKGSSGLGAMVTGQLGLTSPRRTTNLTAQTLNRMQKTGQTISWIKGLRSDMRDQLLGDAMKMRVITQGVANSIQAEEQTHQQIIDQSSGQ